MSSRYKILTANLRAELEAQVNLYLEDGYVLAQPLMVIESELVQVMIKHDDTVLIGRYM